MRDEHKPMTDEELAAIQGRLTKATPGPWKAGKDDFTKNIIEVAKDRGTIIVQRRDDHNMFWNSYIPIEQTFADAALIAHAPDDISRLLAEVRRLNKVSRYLAEQMVHDGGAGLKWAGAFDEDCMRMYKTREEAIQSWIDEANRAVNNDDE